MEMEVFKSYEDAMRAEAESGETNYGTYRAEVMEGVAEFSCQSCGGELVTSDTTLASKCPYCGNNAIIMSKMAVNSPKPDFVIPFKLDKESAKSKLCGFYKGKTLLPKAFKNNSTIDCLTAMYVPFWLYDCDTENSANYDGTRSKTWTKGDTRFTQTDHFLLTRAGQMRFEKIPVDAAKKMDSTVMESIEPYNYSDLTAFSSAYLSGFLADKADVDFEAVKPKIDGRIRNSVDKAIRNTVSGYQNVKQRNLSVNVKNPKVSYAMFPVYTLNTKWGNKNYAFTMNGQTGKMVGALPMDKKKAGIIGAVIFAVLAAIIIGIGAAIEGGEHILYAVIGGLVVGLLASLITILVMKGKLKTIKSKNEASSYTKGLNLTNQRDLFLHSRTTQQKIQSASTTAARAGASNTRPPSSRPPTRPPTRR
jgi:predicted RNA-binding Zn-ribbon protein involved in translation (DUF1610 family)